jgi:copper oxidase (laccase) domain-containing protein
VAGVVPATLTALRRRGADLGTAEAHLGPSICSACYVVDADRAAQIAASCPEAVAGDRVDLRAGVVAQLAAQGIPATADARCTAEDPDLYSYRRDGVTGRQALAIVRAVS